jgi:hypothetical protein
MYYEGTTDGTHPYFGEVTQAASGGFAALEGYAWRCFNLHETGGELNPLLSVSVDVTAETTPGRYLPATIAGAGDTNGASRAAHLYVETYADYRNEPNFASAISASSPSVTFDGERFVAGGANGTLLESNDGKEWRPIAQSHQHTFIQLRYLHGRLIASVSDSDDGEGEGTFALWESTDGQDWTPVTTVTQRVWDVAAGPDAVLAAGSEGMFRSVTAGTWTKVAEGEHLAVAFGDGVYLAGSWGGPLTKSADGITWENIEGDNYDTRDIAFANGAFVIATNQGAYFASATSVATVQPIPGFSYPNVWVADGRFFMPGGGFFTHTSLDGQTWMPVAFPNIKDVAASDAQMVIASGGNLYATAPPVMATDELAHAFGTLSTQNQAVKQFEIRNLGTGDFLLGESMVAGEGFTLQNDSCSAKPLFRMDVCTVEVVFQPSAVSTYAGTFEVAATWPVAQVLTFNVTGQGLSTGSGNGGDDGDNGDGGDNNDDRGNAPTVPTLVAPQNGAKDISLSPTLRWKKSSDPDGDAVSYSLLLCEDKSFETCDARAVQTASLPAPEGFLRGFGALSIVMFGVVALGRRRQSLVLALFVIASVPGVYGCGAAVPITDTNTPGGTNGDDAKADEIAYRVESLQPNTVYYWKVIAADDSGNSAESAVWSFTTGKE